MVGETKRNCKHLIPFALGNFVSQLQCHDAQAFALTVGLLVEGCVIEVVERVGDLALKTIEIVDIEDEISIDLDLIGTRAFGDEVTVNSVDGEECGFHSI